MQKQIGFVGLGNMGLSMVQKLIEKGYEVHAWNRSEPARLEAQQAGAKVFDNLDDLVSSLKGPRMIWSMVAAGSPVDEILGKLSKLMKKGDIFIDGANSYYHDSIRRGQELGKNGIYFFDAGVSGGINGARNGACIMVGGNKKIYELHLESIVKDLATDLGYGYFGEIGAGHFVKMVHNAIEYGMMQSIAEGMNLITHSDFDKVDMAKLTDVWNHGSIITGNLMGFLHDALSKDAKLEGTKSVIGSLGTGEWAVREALQREVPFMNISNAVFSRFNSRGQDDFGAKVVQALREEFGNHNPNERPNK